MRPSASLLTLVCLSTLTLLVSGCTLSTTATPTAQSGAAFAGRVHGGQQPITGAHVYLFAANTTGYGGSGIAASTANASVSLLKNVAGITTLDASGGATNGDYYLTTDANGYFSTTGDYTCVPGQQVYLYANGGNPGAAAGTNNTAAGLLALLGTCPSAANVDTTVPYVVVNEVSTVAAAFSFAGFASDAVHVSSSGTTLAQTGIANAFANAANLVTISTGTALATTPAGNGTVPQTEINTLANILAACVNSTGPASTACATLFANAEFAGATGAQPIDTASAAINIAHYPGSNLAKLYALRTGSAPFVPTLTQTSPPLDFAIALQYSGGTISYPYGVAIDSQGSIWATGGGIVTKLSSTGAVLSGTNGYTNAGIKSACGIAIDQYGNAWVTNLNANTISEITTTGVALATYSYSFPGDIANPCGISIDGQGSAWIASEGGNGITKITTNGAISGVAPFGTYTGMPSYVVAVDGAGSAWLPAQGGQSIFEFSNSLSLTSGTTGYTASSLSSGVAGIALDSGGNAWVYGDGLFEFSHSGVLLSGATGYPAASPKGTLWPLAIDGAGNVWIGGSPQAYGASIQEVSNSGATLLSGANGYGKALYEAPYTIAVDGSGDVWYGNTNLSGGNALTELIGIAVPVITPISAGLSPVFTPDGTSRLGTRP